MLEVNNLSKSYNDNLVLDNISFSIKKGDIVSVVGPSGSGKSTLLRCIDLLEKSEGEILFEGKKLYKGEIGKKIGMVFQQFNLFPHLSVLDNIILAPTKLKLMAKKDATKKAYELLDTIDLKDKANSYPNELSGGQKQRVAIIRTLIIDPDIILFDEPTSALDPEMIGEVLELIKEIANTGKTMMIVSHEMGFVKNVSNRVLFLEDGKILFDGKTKDFFDSSNDRIKGFLKKIEN
ncbi:MAG: amino acid ABC transporter ATP-binding protein [Firmicutes bacterium]|nr:amino acid ABC transporter ATP-binding protein [Bacillota bacterium]